MAGFMTGLMCAFMRQLKNRAQFVRAARGKKVNGRFFTLQAIANHGDDAPVAPGVGLTVTKREGNAPERNRIKRRLRAAVAQSRSAFADCHDYVLIGRRAILSASFADVVGAIQTSTAKLAPNRKAGQKAH